MFLKLDDKILNLNRVISIQICDYEKECSCSELYESGEETITKFYLRVQMTDYECHDSKDFDTLEKAREYLNFLTIKLDAIRD